MTKTQLPPDKAALLDPRIPLGETLERYWARQDKVLNMLRLVDGFGVIAATLSFMIALTTQKEKLPLTGALLLVTVAVMAVCLVLMLLQKKAGGDLFRRGFYLLEDGLLVWDGREALWYTREEITGFGLEPGKEDYAPAFFHPQLADGRQVPGVSLYSVQMNAVLHRAYLERWRETGEFSMDTYTHIARTEGD